MGELQKRIDKLREIYANYEQFGWSKEAEEYIDDFEKKVEEMKKEIEAWRQKHPCYVAEKQTERDYVDQEKFYEARDEWLHEGMTLLEKWLGLPILF